MKNIKKYYVKICRKYEYEEICENMKKYVKNMKNCAENMKKYVGNTKKYVALGITRAKHQAQRGASRHSLYKCPGNRKNFELSP